MEMDKDICIFDMIIFLINGNQTNTYHINFSNISNHTDIEIIRTLLFDATNNQTSIFNNIDTIQIKSEKLLDLFKILSQKHYYDFYEEIIVCLMINEEVVGILRNIIFARDHNNNTLLHIFCRNNFDIAIQILLELVDCRQVINTTNVNGETPLLVYINSRTYGGLENVIFTSINKLLKNGADPNIATNYHTVPLMYTLYYGYELISVLLLNHGADSNIMINREIIDPRRIIDRYDFFEDNNSAIKPAMWYALVNEEERTIKNLLLNGNTQYRTMQYQTNLLSITGKTHEDIELCDPVAFQIMLWSGFNMELLSNLYGVCEMDGLPHCPIKLRRSGYHVNNSNVMDGLLGVIDVDNQYINYMKDVVKNNFNEYKKTKKYTAIILAILIIEKKIGVKRLLTFYSKLIIPQILIIWIKK